MLVWKESITILFHGIKNLTRRIEKDVHFIYSNFLSHSLILTPNVFYIILKLYLMTKYLIKVDFPRFCKDCKIWVKSKSK